MSAKIVHFPAGARPAFFRKTLTDVLRMRDRAQRESAKVGQLPPAVADVILASHGRLDMFVVKIAGRRQNEAAKKQRQRNK